MQEPPLDLGHTTHRRSVEFFGDLRTNLHRFAVGGHPRGFAHTDYSDLRGGDAPDGNPFSLLQRHSVVVERAREIIPRQLQNFFYNNTSVVMNIDNPTEQEVEDFFVPLFFGDSDNCLNAVLMSHRRNPEKKSCETLETASNKRTKVSRGAASVKVYKLKQSGKITKSRSNLAIKKALKISPDEGGNVRVATLRFLRSIFRFEPLVVEALRHGAARGQRGEPVHPMRLGREEEAAVAHPDRAVAAQRLPLEAQIAERAPQESQPGAELRRLRGLVGCQVATDRIRLRFRCRQAEDLQLVAAHGAADVQRHAGGAPGGPLRHDRGLHRHQ